MPGGRAMTLRTIDQRSALGHAFNNLFAKILGAAELALDDPLSRPVRGELETIVRLVGEGCGLVDTLRRMRGQD
ncbi:hypothetical protein [Phenylobacterium sp.]|uniref:hypothetical protein n=1 Tax=Phenylobacterium sp. TaxID=1871053 RepID=UPI0025F7DF3D|nr:hypothetical protein [Phenylobacterium sp.]